MNAFDEFERCDESIVFYQPPTTDARAPTDVQRIKSAFIRTCGERVPTDHRLKIGDSAEFERFAREYSIRFEHFLSDGANQYGWIQAIQTQNGYEICLCSKLFGSDDVAAGELVRLEDVDSSGRSALSHANRIITDGGQPEPVECLTVGCENLPLDSEAFCEECVGILPGILDGDEEKRENKEEGHQIFAETTEADEADKAGEPDKPDKLRGATTQAREAFAELPGPNLGLDKVGLDDHLREWATDGDLSAVLTSAKPAREHSAYDPQDAAIDAADRDRPDPLQVAALEQGIIHECDDLLAGENFTRAYHLAREQYGAPPSDHFITTACDEAYHKLGKINSAEGESHLPAGRSQQSSTCFFPAQDNIVCHSPSDGYRLLSSTTARAANSLGHDDSPGRQRWKNGAHQ